MPIRLRLALVVSVIAAVLVGAGGLLFTTNMVHDMRATLERSLGERAQRVDLQLAARLLPLASGHGPVPAAPDQSLVQVLTVTGTLRYTTEPAGQRVLLGAAELAAAEHLRVWGERRRPGWRNPRLLLAEPGPRGTGLVVVVGTSLDQVQDSTAHVDRGLAIGGPLVVLLSAAGAWVLAGRALRPVEELRAEAATLSQPGPPRRLAVPGTRDELASLATTLNDLLDRVHQSLSEQRHFVAAASHELRTPLAALRAELELADRPDRDEAELAHAVATSARRVDQLVQLSNRLLLLAEADEGVLRVRSDVRVLQPVVADALEAQRAHAEQRDVVLVLDAEPGVEAVVDETRLREVVDNLLDNAIRHAPVGSLVEISLRSGTQPGWSELEVRDHGPGFAPTFLPLAFEPFSRPDRSRARVRGGSGLGLAIVRKIVDAHCGTVVAANHPDGGAVVLVRLPAARSSEETPPPVTAAEPPPASLADAPHAPRQPLSTTRPPSPPGPAASSAAPVPVGGPRPTDAAPVRARTGHVVLQTSPSYPMEA